MGRKWLLCMCSLLILTGCGQTKTYWTEEVRDARVSLRDGTEDGTVDLVLRRDEGETVIRTMTEGKDFSKVGDISAQPFTDILSSNGFILHTEWLGGAFDTNDYYALEENGAVQIAETYGAGEAAHDYSVDLDEDGGNELVNNAVTGGDGHAFVQVYQRRQDGIWVGRMDLKDLPGHDNWGVNSTSVAYDPERNVFQIKYSVKDQAEPEVLETTGLERIAFSPYQADR